LRIALDLDGTLWQYKTFFRELAWALTKAGHEVGILTGHAGGKEADLHQLELQGFPPPAFFINGDGRDVEGDHKTWKQVRAKANGVDVLFDDWGVFGAVECWVNGPKEQQG
jgi:hypothetical protein